MKIFRRIIELVFVLVILVGIASIFSDNKTYAQSRGNDCSGNTAHITRVYFRSSNSDTTWEVRAKYEGRGIDTGWDFYFSNGTPMEIPCYAARDRDTVTWSTSCVDPEHPVDVYMTTNHGPVTIHHANMWVTCYTGRGGIYKACDSPNNKGYVYWDEICPGTPDCATKGKLDVCNKGSNFCGSDGNACDRLTRYCDFDKNYNNWCSTRVSDNNNATCAENNNRCFNDNQCGRNQICSGDNGTCGRCVTVCTLSGIVYIDENNNGRLDDNDRRVNNAEVQLTNFSPNRSTRTNSDGRYSFGNLTSGSEHDVRLTNPDSGRFRIEGNNPRNNQTCNDAPNFRLTRREYSINGTVFIDSNNNSRIDTQTDAKYRRGATVTAGGRSDRTGTNAPNVGDYSIGGFINGDYNVRLSDYPTNYIIVGDDVKIANINDGNDNNVNFLLRQTQPDTSFNINGTIYVNTNGRGGLQTTETTVNGTRYPPDTRLKNYQGGNTNPNIRVNATGGSINKNSAAINNNSQFSVTDLPNGTYSVSVTNASFTGLNPASAQNPRNVTVNSNDVNNINFLLAPATGNSISGGVFLDENDDGVKQGAEPYTTGAADSPHLTVTAGGRTDNQSGQFSLAGFSAGSGSISVSMSAPPAGFRATWPTNGSRSVSVNVGTGCTDNPDNHWDCSGGNVTNLNFGITPDTQVDRWLQAEGGDIRADNGLNNIVPGSNYLSRGSTNMSYGVVIGQNINIGGRNRANEKGWLINNSSYAPNTIRTSYSQVITTLKRGGVWDTSKPMFAGADRPCEGSDQAEGKCELKDNIAPGIYRANRNVTLQEPTDDDFTFGAGDYVFVIDGNLRIETNINVPVGTTVMFVSNESITVASNISNIAGMYSADNNFIVQNPGGGQQGQQLIIQGSVIANAALRNRQTPSQSAGTFRNNRDLLNDNYVSPSVLFVYRPDFVLNAPEIFKYSTYKIQEVSPQTIESAARGTNPGGGGGGGIEEQCYESNADFCARVGRNPECGEVSGTDICGNPRTVYSCGVCSVAGETCGGDGRPNKCGAACTETDAQFCARVGKNCGEVTGTSCGVTKTVNCGSSCPSGQTCGGGGTPNKCGAACTPESDAKFCERKGKNCGRYVGLDNCDNPRTVESCGECTGNKTCGGGGTANVCGNPDRPQEPKCESGNYKRCLWDEFKVLLHGRSAYLDDEAKDIFTILAEPGASNRYKQLLRESGPNDFYFVNDASVGGGCPSRVQPNGDGTSRLTLTNWGLRCDRKERRSRLVHETGHIIRNGHIRLYQRFMDDGYYPKDKDCYYRYVSNSDSYWFIKSYSTAYAQSLGLSSSGANESMAELMSLVIVPDSRYPAYPEKCEGGNRWIRNNIYDNDF
jgi:hypothetical protein